MGRLLDIVACVALFAGLLAGQDDEARFNAGQADKLNKFAKQAFDKGFPRQARLIWMQTIKLYDADDEDAHKALGHVRSGSSWAPDPGFEYPLDDTGDSRDGASLFKAYEKLKEDLADAHRKQARKWAKADRTDKAHEHFRMLLRWVKDDEEAQQALEHREIGGVTGTGLEQTLFDRSKAIERAVDEQTAVEYPVEKVDAKAPVLDRAQVPYVTVKSEHFVLHGDPDQEEFLKQALVWAERSLRICEAAFPWKTEVRGEWAFFTSKDTYKQILRANADQVPNLEWRLEHTSTSGLGNLVVGATGSVQVLFDACVRNVAKTYAQFRSDGLSEGIGHTFVGMTFNNNRLFAVDLEKQQGTTATEEDREYTSPDFDVWKNLALEMAWKMSGGVPAIDIAYADAATFSNEQRIKAWSLCDYMMRRDPTMLRKLDELAVGQKQSGQRRPLDLQSGFEQATGVTLAQIDKEWEDFWTEATPVLQAIRNNTPPLSAISRGVEKWLEAFNAVRGQQKAAAVTWSSNLSTRCKEHAEYLKANKDERGPAAEHRQIVELGGSHLGNMFAQMAIVETQAKLAKAEDLFEDWMRIPGYRDALVHDFLRSVGIYTEGDILVMNVVSGLGAPKSKSAGFLCHPWKHATNIPTEVEVAKIGPELEELLRKHGHERKKVVGYPLTIHFGQSVQGDRTSYRCNAVDARGNKIEGLILLDSGKIRRSTAPGMVTFYPLDPLPRGAIQVTWSWEVDGQARTLDAGFTTK
jgi:hypothetical protein